MNKFAKLFQFDDIGQVLVKIDADDNGDPEVRFYFKPDGYGVCSTAYGFEDSDGETKQEKAQKAFDLADEELTGSIVRSVLKTIPTQLAQ